MSTVDTAIIDVPTDGTVGPVDRGATRETLVRDLNAGDFIFPVTEDGDIAVGSFETILQSSDPDAPEPVLEDGFWSSFVKALVPYISEAATAIGAAIGGAPGAGIGLAIGEVIENAVEEANSGGSTVTDLVLVDQVRLEGEDFTRELIAAAEKDSEAHDSGAETFALRTFGPDASITFLDPDLLNPAVLDVEGADVTDETLGADTFLVRSEDNVAFGYAIYNDPALTGRVVGENDSVQIDVTDITPAPPGTTVELRGALFVANEDIRPPDDGPPPDDRIDDRPKDSKDADNDLVHDTKQVDLVADQVDLVGGGDQIWDPT